MKLSFSAGIISNGKLYFSDNFSNALMALDMETNEMRFIRSFPDESKAELLHKKAFEYNGNIFFTPFQGDHVHIYSPRNGSMESVSIPKSPDDRYAVSDAAVIDDLMMIFPGNLSQPVVTIDLKNLSVDTWGTVDHKGLAGRAGTAQAFRNIVVKGSVIYSVVVESDMIVKYDVAEHCTELIKTGVNELCCVYSNEPGIWLSTQNNGVYLWNENDASPEYIPMCGGNVKSCPYVVIRLTDEVMALSNKGGDVYFYNAEKKSFEKKSDACISESVKNRFGYIYEGYDLRDDGVILFPIVDGDPWLIRKDGSVSRIDYSFDDPDGRYKKNYYMHNIAKEGSCGGLADFIKAIS